MNEIRWMPILARKFLLYRALGVGLLTLFWIGPAAAQMLPHQLSGEAFTSPSAYREMPAGWGEDPIRYDEWARGAKIVATIGQDLYLAFQPLVQEYARRENVDVALKEGTCGIAAGMLKRRKADIGGFCCAPSASDRLPGLEFHTLGIGPVALLVHPENPLVNLSMAEARAIFQGQRRQWSSVDGSLPRAIQDLPIRVTTRLHCKARPGHWRLLLDNEELFSARTDEVKVTSDVIARIAAYKGSIGFETLWSVARYRNRGDAKPITLNGFDPRNLQALAQAKYPLYRVYNLTLWKDPNARNPMAAHLVKYLREQVELKHQELGLVPPSVLKANGWKFVGGELTGEP
ncbi:MAG: hypothetical protein DRQ37_04600 [Gammaproteobacteria bacterium]|nr:MAG: hypothetical protein DRQ37_04600 [Gammaproteobacteria bacterium]